MNARGVIFDLGGVVLGSPMHAIADYERGTALKSHCERKLSEAQAKLEKTVSSDGDLTLDWTTDQHPGRTKENSARIPVRKRDGWRVRTIRFRGDSSL